MTQRFFRLATITLCAISLAMAQQEKKAAVIDPAKADADFRVQGEYSGELDTNNGKAKWGVQVIALGGGKFDAVAYRGGLPGDGWDRTDKIRAAGQTAGGVTTIRGDEGAAKIQDGALNILDD